MYHEHYYTSATLSPLLRRGKQSVHKNDMHMYACASNETPVCHTRKGPDRVHVFSFDASSGKLLGEIFREVKPGLSSYKDPVEVCREPPIS